MAGLPGTGCSELGGLGRAVTSMTRRMARSRFGWSCRLRIRQWLIEDFFKLHGKVRTCRIVWRFKALNRMAGTVENELGEVPTDGSAGGSLGRMREEVNQGDGMNSGERGERRNREIKILLCVPSGNGGRIGKLFVAEVCGGNAEDDQTFGGVGLLKLAERRKLRGVNRLAGKVDDQQYLAPISRQRLKLAAGHDDREIPGRQRRIVCVSGESCRKGVKREREKQARKRSENGAHKHRLELVSH